MKEDGRTSQTTETLKRKQIIWNLCTIVRAQSSVQWSCATLRWCVCLSACIDLFWGFFYVLTYRPALHVVGTDAPLFVTSSRDSQRHLTWLPVNVSWGSNTKLCQIYRGRRSYNNNALTFKSLSHPYNARLPARECLIIPILNGVFFVII